jgi:hypothetical protein
MSSLERLQTVLARQLAAMGWNDDCSIYNRDWKKDVAETKRRITLLTRFEKAIKNAEKRNLNEVADHFKMLIRNEAN